jgi:hypothetical protein
VSKFQPFRYGDFYLVGISAVDKSGLSSNFVSEFWSILD